MEIPEKISSAIVSMKNARFEDDFDEIVNTEFDRIKLDLTHSEFLAQLFIVCKSNTAKIIVKRINNLLEELTLDDLIKSYEIMGEDELSVYYFARFIVEECNIDALKLTERSQSLSIAHGYTIKSLPIASIQLNTSQISNRLSEFRDKLKSQGAPMLDD